MSLSTNVQNLATRVGTEIKSVRVLVNGNVADLTGLTTTAKTDLVAAINEVNARSKQAVTAAGATINDTTPSSSTTYSSQKVDSQVQAAIAGLVGGAPAALDTLKELSDALSTKSDASVITTALAAKANASDVGDTNVNYVLTFEAALK